MFKQVIVGVDGREGGRDATLLAKRLCGEHGVLTLAYVYPLEPSAWRGTTPGYDVEQRKQAQELLGKTRGEAGVEARLRVLGPFSVGRGLHELAEETDADLIVVGSSGRGLFGRVLVGGDTRAALNGAPCAIAVAPAGYGQHSAAMRKIGVGYDGSRSYGPMGRLVHGSTTLELARTARCPLLVLTRATRQPGKGDAPRDGHRAAKATTSAAGSE